MLISNLRIKFAKIVGEQHISCTLQGVSGATLPAICFRCVGNPLHSILMSNKDVMIDVVGTLQINDFQGSPQLIIDDIRQTNEKFN